MDTAMVRIVSPGRQPLQLVLTAELDVGREGDGLLVADDRVSRRHARLEPAAGGGVRITDLGSANGVVIDGKRIDESVVVAIGQMALIGDTRIEVLSTSISLSDAGATTRTTIAAPSNRSRPSVIVQMANEVSEIQQPDFMRGLSEPGTLSIVFSDIEASTSQAIAHGDTEWMKILSHHNDLISRHVTAYQGRIVRNQGDGFMMSFRSARLALLAAIDMQRNLREVELTNPALAVRVRIGMHTGEVLQDDDGELFGRHVMVAARVGDLAQGGQILVSGVLKQIAEPRGDILFGDPVSVQLKGFEAEQTVHEVDWQAISIDEVGSLD